MENAFYQSDKLGSNALEGNGIKYPWENYVKLKPGGKISFQEHYFGSLRIVSSKSFDSVLFRRSYSGVKKRESRFINFVFVFGGILKIKMASIEIVVNDECFAIIKEKNAYSAEYMPYDKKYMEVFSVAIPKNELPLILNDKKGVAKIAELKETDLEVFYRISRLIQSIGNKVDQYEIDYLIQIMIRHANIWYVNSAIDSKKIKDTEDIFEQIKIFIKNNISDSKLKADDICTQFRISNRYLSLILKRNGTNLRHLINIHRINNAKDLFDKLSVIYSIEEVASLVGYCSASHFSLSFKTLLGMTPTEYRNRSRDRSGCL